MVALAPYVLALCTAASAAGLDISPTGGAYDFSRDGRPALRYWAAPEALKPFVDPLLTPAGHSVTTTRSGQPQHHGLWVTWGKVLLATGQSVDFWSESGDPAATGQIAPRPGTRPRVEVRMEGAWLVTENEWRRRSDGLVLLRERRAIGLLDCGSPRANLLTIVSEQTAERDLTILHEANEAVAYYGIALQMPPDMNSGLVVNSHGAQGRAGVEGIPAPWCAYSTTVVPARGVALFDHPTNPRHPNQWFTLDSGFLSTSLVAREDYALKAGETLRLCWGVLAFDGDVDPGLVAQQYEAWARLPLPDALAG